MGAVLDELAADGRISASARTAIRLLMLTACRRSEILTLKWEDVDLEHDELRLRNSKTGARGGPAVAGRQEDSCRAAPHPPATPGSFRGARPAGAWAI